jgi:hypothetical protein
LGEYENDKMQIYCTNSPFYSYADIDKTKHLSLKWIHKFDNDKYQLMDMKSLNDMGITLKWFKYKINNKNIDKIAGRNWEEIRVIGNDKFKCDFVPD